LVDMKPNTGKLLSHLLQIIFSNSIYLALNGASVFVFASLLYGTEISLSLLLASFLITFAVYSLNIVTDSKEDAINRAQTHPKRAKCYLVLSVLSMITSLTIGIIDNLSAFFVLMMPLLIGLIYSIRISKSFPRLKEIVGVKSIVVALSWGVTGAFLPATLYSIPIYKLAMVFFYVFAQILVNTIIFDALDVKGDHASGIKTVPLALGLKKTRALLLGINASFVVWFVYCLFSGAFLEYIVTLAFGVVYETLIICYFLKANRPRLQAELLVDGEWVYLVFLMRLFIFK
jgi:4-hydroxybenzoate polyprenyltransferase